MVIEIKTKDYMIATKLTSSARPVPFPKRKQPVFLFVEWFCHCGADYFVLCGMLTRTHVPGILSLPGAAVKEAFMTYTPAIYMVAKVCQSS